MDRERERQREKQSTKNPKTYQLIKIYCAPEE